MKKIALLFVALLCLSVLLSACDATDPDNLFGTTVAPSVSATEPEGEGSLAAMPGYQYGNMQKNLPSGNYMRYEDTVLFFELKSQGPFPLYEYDMQTGEVSLFCKDATCGHSTGKCATGGVDSNLEQYDGRFFAAKETLKSNVVMELKDGRFEEVLEGVSLFWHGNGNLYVTTEDASLLVYENGSTAPRMLVEEYVGIWNVVFGDYLYGSTGHSVIRVDLRARQPQAETVLELNYSYSSIIDGQHIYYSDADETGSKALYRCDMDGSDPTQIFEGAVANINFDDEYLYLVLQTQGGDSRTDLSKDVYRVSKEDPTQVEIIASLPEIAAQVFTVPGFDKVFVTTRLAPEGEEYSPIYAVNIDGSGVEKLVLPEF